MAEQFLGLSAELWLGAILGLFLTNMLLILKFIGYKSRMWYEKSRPRMLILEGMANNDEDCLIFIRHLYIENVDLETTPLKEYLPRLGITGRVPNVRDLWADVDGTALANVLNVLGQAGKKSDIRIIRMSEDHGEWNGHIVVIGGQSEKSFDFFEIMQPIFFKMTNTDIYDVMKKRKIPRDPYFGYGIIVKARNPKRTGKLGVAFLIGGFGTLGTEAASYYLREHLNELGKEFGNRCFGIVVRASISAGYQSVERLKQYDRVERDP